MSEAGDGDAGGGDIFDDAPSTPKGKADGALPPKPGKEAKAKEEPAKPKANRSQQEKRNDADKAADKLTEHLAEAKAKAEKAERKSKPKAEPTAATLKDEPGEPKKAAKPKAEAEPAEDGDAPAAKPKAKPVAAPKAPEPPKADPALEGRLVRAVQDLRNAESVAKQLRAEKEQATAKLAEYEKKVKAVETTHARAKNREEAYDFFHEQTGLTLKDLLDGLEDGSIKPARARASLPPEVQERIDRAEAEMTRLSKIEEERSSKAVKDAADAEQRQKFDTHLKQTKEWLSENAAEFPALARIPWAAQQVLQGAYQNGGQLEVPARKLQESLVGDLSLLLDDDTCLDVLDGKLSQTAKERIAKKWGLKLEADNDNDEEEEEEIEDEEEDEEEEERKAAVKPHKRKPASRVATESTPRSKLKGMDKHERAEYANSMLAKFLRDNKSSSR